MVRWIIRGSNSL